MPLVAMTNPQTSELLAKSIEPSSVVVTGQYTNPRTWGVYEVPAKSTTRFRFGNHPVRQQELVREFGTAKLIGLFESRSIARQLSALLNDGPRK